MKACACNVYQLLDVDDPLALAVEVRAVEIVAVVIAVIIIGGVVAGTLVAVRGAVAREVAGAIAVVELVDTPFVLTLSPNNKIILP